MNIQSRMPTTADEFLRWNEGRKGKREFVRGRVVELPIHVTRNHASIAANLVIALGQRLDLKAFSVGSADFAIQTPDGVRYPDMYVDRITPLSKGRDLAATEPLFLAEILSSSSLGRDFVEKLSDYTAVPTLLHYLILSQEEPRVWLWTRVGPEEWTGPTEIADEEQAIELSGIGVSVALAEFYNGVELRAGA